MVSPAPAPIQSAHAIIAPARSWTTSSGGIWKPEDTGLQTTDPDMNGFVGRLPSNAYFAGQIVGTLHGLAMMGANAATNIARQGSIVRYFWDPRTWKSVVRTWSGRPPILRANGLSLHHVLIPQRWTSVLAGFRNAGMNYIFMSTWRNSVILNRLAPLRPVEWAYRFGYLTQFNPLFNPLVGQ